MDQTLAGVGRERFRRPAANDPHLRCRSPNAQFTGRFGAGFYWGRKTGSGPDCANSRSNFQQTSASGKCRPVVADGTVRSQDAKIIRRRRARDQGSVSNAAEPFATVAKGSLRSRSRAAGAIIYRTPPCASPPVLRGSGTFPSAFSRSRSMPTSAVIAVCNAGSTSGANSGEWFEGRWVPEVWAKANF